MTAPALAPAPAPARRRPPVDPRLWRYAQATRNLLAVSVVISVLSTICTIVIAYTVARIAADLITLPETRSLTTQAAPLVWAGAAVVARASLAYAQGRFGHRSAERVTAQLRSAALRTRPTAEAQGSTVLTAVTRGLDELSPYLTGYVPALALTVIATPLVIAVILIADPLSGLITLITLPLIPVFMVLIGLTTRDRTHERLTSMARLSSQTLDLIAGLPTLRALGRAQGPRARVQELGEVNSRETFAVLRVAFLSALVLDVFATLCVALVAVEIGLRLVGGHMSLFAGIFALVLAPEVYLPLRTVGAQFHAAQNGITAATTVLDVIDAGANEPPPAARAADGIGREPIEIRGLTVIGRDGAAPDNVTATVRPGELTVITGPNGVGKSTLFAALLGVIPIDAGEITCAGKPLGGGTSLWKHVAWCPQDPVIVPGTIAENFALLGLADVAAPAVQRAAVATGFSPVITERGWHTPLGTRGHGLSLGERQRLALTRTLATERPVLLLDEPTAHLDAVHENTVLAELQDRARNGATVVVIAHHQEVLAAADTIIEMGRARG